jgi:hypothetical protein
VGLDVAHELLRMKFPRRVVVRFDQAVEVVEGKLGVHRYERPVEVDDSIDPLASAKAVLELVLVPRERVGEEVAQKKLAEPAARFWRTKRLLEPGEILRAVEHLRVRLADPSELLMDGSRRAGRALEPVVDSPVELAESPVHRLDDSGEAAVDVGVPLGELLAGGRPELVELSLEPDGERRDGGENEGCDECGHGPTNARERVGRHDCDEERAARRPPSRHYVLSPVARSSAARSRSS